MSASFFFVQTGEGLDNFWKVLLEGRNCSVPIPKERFDLAGWYDPDDNKAGKSRTAKAALIDGYAAQTLSRMFGKAFLCVDALFLMRYEDRSVSS